MKFVIFGLTISSSWGNGHATLWRGLCKALARRGHRVVFFERDVPYYALNRDLTTLPYGELCLYPSWDEALPVARWHLADADVAMVTSYCPDGVAATDAVLEFAGCGTDVLRSGRPRHARPPAGRRAGRIHRAARPQASSIWF